MVIVRARFPMARFPIEGRSEGSSAGCQGIPQARSCLWDPRDPLSSQPWFGTLARAVGTGDRSAYIRLKCSGLSARSTISSAKGTAFSRRQSHARCAQGHVDEPLWVFRLFQNLTGGPSYGSAMARVQAAAG
jgi:hypothetical protein